MTLYLLNNRLTKNDDYLIRNGNWSDLRKALESVIYDGGTNFGAIRLKNISCNEFLFFSDGLSSLSDANFVAPDNEIKNYHIHCIVSSAKADYSAMKWIAAQTKGKFINLNALSSESLQREIVFETLHFLGTEHNEAVREIYPSVPTPVQGNFSIAGILDENETKMTLLFGYGNKTEKRITVKLKAKDAQKQGHVHRIWAQKKINELDLQYEQNKEELTELGQQFGIVTRNTSLIVLETLQDYIRYNIVPPTELQEEYFRWKKGQQEELRQQQQTLLNSALSQAQALQNWWKTDFSSKKRKYPQPDHVPSPPTLLGTATTSAISEDRVAESIDIVDLQDRLIMQEEAPMQLSEVVVAEAPAETNYNKSKNETRSSQAIIKLLPIKQENEYNKQLTGKTVDDYAVYLRLRPEYINTPTFYFDMADWFFRHNDREKALRILTSIAELDLENASLYRLLGYRLKEYKEYALEAYICRKVIAWRPMEPQSYRDYALALADNAQYQTALDSLYSVLTQSYPQNIGRRSQGIEEVIITEMNQLITQRKSLNTHLIDKKLIQTMPVDIRVLINWNMNNTDIDLYVKDPQGETCFYSHRETKMGGRISQDVTQGYGPEQFMLRKARKGKYQVFVNYYGDSQVKAEGPSTIMAEIYTYYSDASEQRRIVCLQMSKETKAKDGLIKVAEFEF